MQQPIKEQVKVDFKRLNLDLQLLIRTQIIKIRVNVFWTEDLILRKLAEEIISIRSIDKKLLSNYQLTRFENTDNKNNLKVKYYFRSGQILFF